MKRKWKILLACVVVVAAVAAMTVGICARYVLHYLAVEGDFEISFIRAGETLEDITEQIDQDTLDAIKGLVLGAERGGYRVGCSPWLSESSVEINGRDSEGLWHIYLCPCCLAARALARVTLSMASPKGKRESTSSALPASRRLRVSRS